MLEQIAWLLDRAPFIENLCEIGTGNGMLVNYLSRHFSQIDRFEGIDLSVEQIRKNREIYAESRVEYLHVEVGEYVLRRCRPCTLFVACGTFGCFTGAELEEFLSFTLRTTDRVAFAICDGVSIDFDAQVEFISRPRKNLFYNHNYRYLLEKHGYWICLNQLEHVKRICNRVSILATSFPCAEVNSHHRTSE
jgi:hypothetical protein